MNLTAPSTNAKPEPIEVKALFSKFAEELKDFNVGQVSDDEMRMINLEAKFKELEERQKYFEDFLIKRMIDFKEEKTVRGDKD